MKLKSVLQFILFCMLLAFPSLAWAQGKYFGKKSYDGTSLPVYEESADRLPQLILKDKPEYEELYTATWKLVFSKLMTPPEGSPLVANWIDDGLSPQIFQWDTNLAMFFGRYAHHIFPFIKSHDNFYARQHDDGMICRVINEADGSDHYWGLGTENARAINPPLYAWAEWEYYLVSGDNSRFMSVIPVLEKYGEYIEKNRRGWDTPHKLYWSNGQASGMDNTPRDLGRPEPGDGWDCHSAIDHMGWVDMSCQMVMHYRYLSHMCDKSGMKEKARKYMSMSREISGLINKWMWDEEKGLYFDVDTAGNKTDWITVATFWPMVAGVSGESRNRRLVENMFDPELFWRRVPLPTLAYGQKYYSPCGQYWLGGAWAPTNYMAVRGLSETGFEAEATELSCKFLDAIWEVYKKTGTIWETYAPEIYMPSTNAEGIYMCIPDFAGWTALAPISMMIENVIGLRADASSDRLVWNITRPSVHGMKNFRFNGHTVTLVATPMEGGYSVSVTSDGEFLLEVRHAGRVCPVEIAKGTQQFEITD